MAKPKTRKERSLDTYDLVPLNIMVPKKIKEQLERKARETGSSVDQVASLRLDQKEMEKQVEIWAKIILEEELETKYGHYGTFLENAAAEAKQSNEEVRRLLKAIGILDLVIKPKKKSDN